MKREAWEKNWLRENGWGVGEIEELEASDEEVPVEYLVGRARFRDLILRVSEATLIPRLETEKLVDLVKQFIEKTYQQDKDWRLVEVGTGSGAIIFSLAGELLGGNFLAGEISETALIIAKENRRELGLEERVELMRADLLEGIKGEIDVLVANLPYIPLGRRESLDKSVIDYEPHLALFAGECGLDLIEKLLDAVIRRAQKPQAIFLEIDDEHCMADFKRWSSDYNWQIKKDCQGKNRYAIGYMIKERI